MDEREKAVARVLIVLRNPLMLMSIPDRQETFDMIAKHGITIEDVLNVALARARKM